MRNDLHYNAIDRNRPVLIVRARVCRPSSAPAGRGRDLAQAYGAKGKPAQSMEENVLRIGCAHTRRAISVAQRVAARTGNARVVGPINTRARTPKTTQSAG